MIINRAIKKKKKTKINQATESAEEKDTEQSSARAKQ